MNEQRYEANYADLDVVTPMVPCKPARTDDQGNVAHCLDSVLWTDPDGVRWAVYAEDDPTADLIVVRSTGDCRTEVMLEGRPVDQPEAEPTRHLITLLELPE